MYQTWRARLKNNNALRGVAFLAGGTALAQVISVLSSPIATRIYTPANYGVYGPFYTITAIFCLACVLRYEQAIVVQSTDEEAFHAVVGCLMVLLVMAVTSTGIVAGAMLFPLGKFSPIRPYLWWLPVTVVSTGIYQIFNMWALRKRNYKIITQTNVTQSLSGSSSNILLGLALHSPLGFILSAIIATSAGTTRLVRSFLTFYRATIHTISFPASRAFLYRYKQYPLFALPAAILNTSALSLPMIFLMVLYNPTITGYYSLALRIVGLPMALIGSSVTQVFLAETSTMLHTNPEKLPAVFRKTMLHVAIIALCPLIIGCCSPTLFPIIFGHRWKEAGYYALILSIFSAAQIIVSPTSNIVILTGKQHLQFYLDLVRIVCVLLALLIPHTLGFGPRVTMGCYAVTMVLLYAMYQLVYFAILRRWLTTHPHQTESSAVPDDVTVPSPSSV